MIAPPSPPCRHDVARAGVADGLRHHEEPAQRLPRPDAPELPVVRPPPLTFTAQISQNLATQISQKLATQNFNSNHLKFHKIWQLMPTLANIAKHFQQVPATANRCLQVCGRLWDRGQVPAERAAVPGERPAVPA